MLNGDVRRADEMMKSLAIVALVSAMGCTATQTASPRVPTETDIRALLSPGGAAVQIKDIRATSDGAFMVFFGAPDLAPEKFEDGRIIRPPIKVVWTNENWVLRSIFDNRNPGNRKRSANNTSEHIP